MSEKHVIRVERHEWPDERAARKKKAQKRFILGLCFILVFFGGFLVGHLGQSSTIMTASSSSTDSEKFNEIYDIMVNEWYFGTQIEDLETYLLDNAITGLTENDYDSHTNYMDAETAEAYLEKLEGSVTGIGVTFMMIDDQPMITKVYIDSPAEAAGLQEGDILLKISGIELEGKTSDEIASLAKGDAGTSATFVILRGTEEITVEITRAEVSVSAYGYVQDDTAILEISSFSEDTDSEVEAYLEDFQTQGLTNLVIDLRDNGGGYLSTTIKIASYFLEEGEVVLQEEDRDGDISVYTTYDYTTYEFDHIVILVNEDTASASEVLTACLQEHLGATVVGTTTYGKGTVQQSVMFSDGSYLKYTTAEWLTPNGNKIHGVGITPDVEVEALAAMTYSFYEDEERYTLDSVGTNVMTAQIYLDFLGYEVDRTDGYFSEATLDALHEYQADQGLDESDTIDGDTVTYLLSDVQKTYALNTETYDVQLLKAIEVVHE